MATQPSLNQYYVLAGLDYPTHRHYPTQDKCTAEDEAEYIRGWRHAEIQHQADCLYNFYIFDQ